ncbi:MAG: tetratricopeptide repeat protein [Chitinophagaceae bacterium]|nr:tetratricopeptide repeat protein [Chitinophagaceae bacterium]
MRKTITLLLLCTLLYAGVYAQEAAITDLVNKGIELHDKGDYEGAVGLYKKALKLNPGSAFANYENGFYLPCPEKLPRRHFALQ